MNSRLVAIQYDILVNHCLLLGCELSILESKDKSVHVDLTTNVPANLATNKVCMYNTGHCVMCQLCSGSLNCNVHNNL